MNVTYETGQTATWTYIPVYDEQGELVLTVGTGRDITKLVNLEKKLKITETIISQYEGRNFNLIGNTGHVDIITLPRCSMSFVWMEGCRHLFPGFNRAKQVSAKKSWPTLFIRQALVMTNRSSSSLRFHTG